MARAHARAAKQAGEEIAEPIEIGESLAAARIPESLRPVRRRPKLLPVAKITPQLIVCGTLIGVAQHFVGLLHLFEFVLGVFFLADIRVELACQLAVRALYFIGVGTSRQP